MDQALVDVKQGVEEIKYQIPLEAEDPQIQEYTESSFPVMNISIVGGSSVRQKVFYARELKDRIEPIEQILEVRTSGAPEEVLEGVIDKAKPVKSVIEPAVPFKSVVNCRCLACITEPLGIDELLNPSILPSE